MSALAVRPPGWLVAGVTALLVSACGGGGGGVGTTPPPVEDLRGTLLETPVVVGTLSAATLDDAMRSRDLLATTGSASCDVRVLALNYRTPGVRSETSNASAVLLEPTGHCQGRSHPLVAYARSTEASRPRTLASTTDAETLLVAAMYAGQGFAVVASDYLGYAKSSHGFHPYLHADSEATTVVDAIRAARRAVQQRGGALSGRVMLTGYSQGGHASMAAQRAIESSADGDITVAAAAHLAGPYNLGGMLRRADPIVGYQYFIPLLLTSWQKLYGNLYPTPADAFRPPYASTIETLLPSETETFESLRTKGLLPGESFTPEQVQQALIQPAYLDGMKSDAQHPVNVAARRNDLLAWSPRAPTLLCSGSADPGTSFQLHQAVAKDSFDQRGGTPVQSIDVDAQIQARYGIQGRAPTDPASAAYQAYFASYHTHLAPPLCHAQARALFQQVR